MSRDTEINRPWTMRQLIVRIVCALLACLPAVPGVASNAAEPMPREIHIEMTDEIGPVYTDARSRTLYTWKGDRDGQSLCNDDKYEQGKGAGDMRYFLPDTAHRATCQQVWPPAVAQARSKPIGRWSILTRKDGLPQWAYDKQPLYTYVNDHHAGDVNGLDGGVVIARQPVAVPVLSPPNVTVQPSRLGRVLMTVDGGALYVREGETTNRLVCTAACEQTWVPFRAPASAADKPISGWSVFVRPDGIAQWAYHNKPLYTYVDDIRFSLNGVKNANWTAVTLTPPLAPPQGITVQWTADGQVFADSAGKTLYVWYCTEDAADRLNCDRPGSTLVYWRSICGPAEHCMATWRPAVAGSGAKPVGHTWSIVELDPTGAHQFAPSGSKGVRVWAYRGKPLYTFALDHEPGDMEGNNYMAFFQWGYKMVRADDGYGMHNLQ